MSEIEKAETDSLTVFTIGFSKKSAEQFFHLLHDAGVKLVVDIRLNNISQLAGFTKKSDLKFFLKKIAGIRYRHCPEMAPTKDVLDGYKKKKITWEDYEQQYNELLKVRQVENLFQRQELDHSCFLCSEFKPDKCHRRILIEYLQSKWGNINITHL
ncbi:MAG: DUF488 domain-containing protein [Planctomycetota bacterium]|jgi:uncharacterized protein (DUF488 family)